MIRLYPKVDVRGQDFRDVKVLTVPDQSMSLREIIKRFMRRESLPVEKQGIYATGLGDLEKIRNADITVQLDRAAQIQAAIAKGQANDAERRKKAKESASGGPPPTSSPSSVQVPPAVPPAVPPQQTLGA